MSSANSESLHLLLQSGFYLFIYLFSSLIAVAKTCKSMLNSSGEGGHPCLVPDFRVNAFNSSPLRMFAVGFSYMAFMEFPGGSDCKASAYNVGDPGSIRRFGRSSGGGNGSSLQYSCLENPMDRGAW